MKEIPDELRQRIETLEKPHLERCGQPVLRVSASLDLETVLQEIVESARALTDARYGLIATVDDDVPQDLVTAGLTPDDAANGGLALTRLQAAARRTPEAALRDVLARHAGHAAARDVAE